MIVIYRAEQEIAGGKGGVLVMIIFHHDGDVKSIVGLILEIEFTANSWVLLDERLLCEVHWTSSNLKYCMVAYLHLALNVIFHKLDTITLLL